MAPRTVRSTRAAAPAKKSVAPRRPAAPVPVPKKAPAKKAAPAKRAPVADSLLPATEAPDTRPKLQAHDVLRAHLDMVKAQQTFQQLHAAYWAEYGEAVDYVVDHAAAVKALDAPKQQGPKHKDGPVRLAMVEPEKRAIEETFDPEKISLYSLPKLRQLARELAEKDENITETVKKSVIMKQLEEAGYFRSEVDADSDEADDEDEEALGGEDEAEVDEVDDDEEEDDEEEEEDEDDGFMTADILDGYSLRQLREFAEENGVTTKGKKEDALRDELKALLPGEEEDDEEEPDDEEPEEDDDEEEEPEDEDGGYLTPEDLDKLDLEDLLDVAKDTGDKVPAAVAKNAAKLRAWLRPYLEDEEEDDEEE